MKFDETSQDSDVPTDYKNNAEQSGLLDNHDIELNNTPLNIGIVNTIDSLDLSGISKIDLLEYSKSRFYFVNIPLTIVSFGLIHLLAIYIISIRIFLYYTKIPNDVSYCIPEFGDVLMLKSWQ